MARVWLGKTHAIHRLAFWLAVGITGISSGARRRGPSGRHALNTAAGEIAREYEAERPAPLRLPLSHQGVERPSQRGIPAPPHRL